jgi:hypothetical protein
MAGTVSLICAPLFGKQLVERLEFSAPLGADPGFCTGGHAEALGVDRHVSYLCHGLREYVEWPQEFTNVFHLAGGPGRSERVTAAPHQLGFCISGAGSIL